MATVVVERLQPHEYLSGCAVLPRDYGSASWDDRPEVKAIRSAVFAALDRLDAESGVGKRFEGRKVLVKPNLVMVFDHMGTRKPISPESTDPRVFDAVILWLQKRARAIDIVESSGRGSPTRAAFTTSGMDRLARHRGCGLVALEETPVDRYFLPKAKVQREILVPRAFSEVVRGEAAYVSVPKLKTNLYTEVTLGFKNAMGVIPYNLRQRHHHYAIDRKLVEMLYLFRPDLVLIDGVVGGEGECPAPVDPVDSRIVIAGDQAVETDRVATRLMGFEPSGIELMRVADELGFGDAKVKVIGDTTPVAFRPADRSLLSDRVRASFPGLKILIGIDRLEPAQSGGPALAKELEKACWGGGAATTRFGLALIEAEGLASDKEGVLILGPGLPVGSGGSRSWFDAEGKAWNEEAIFALPGRKAVIGSCGSSLASRADIFVEGCMPLANAPHMAIHKIMGTNCPVLSTRNARLGDILFGMVAQRSARRRLIKAGERLDIPFETQAAPVVAGEPPVVGEPGKESGEVPDWMSWPLPPTNRAERKRLLAFEDDASFASLRGEFQDHAIGKLFWKSQAWTTPLVTFAPLLLAGLGALGLDVGLAASTWFTIWLGIEALHAAELPFAFAAMKKFRARTGRGRPSWKTLLLTLCMGYPCWVPWSLLLHD